MKVIIIGGGIAGLSAAFQLCQVPNIEVELYEKEDDIGGQARSQFGKFCYIEYSWRIFGQSYNNLNYIIKAIGAEARFEILKGSCIINGDKPDNGALHPLNLAYQSWKQGRLSTLSKLLGLTTLCKERAINEYDHINAYEYLDRNPILQTVLGPFFGLEANKVSLSAFLKNALSTSQKATYAFSPPETRISKYPTQQSLFIPWRDYLLAHGVRIFVNSPLTSIEVQGPIIKGITINGKAKTADEYIMALSLSDLLSVVGPPLSRSKTMNNLRGLLPSLQLYYTINIYFSEELGSHDSEKDSPTYCAELILVDMPWKPIIQKKRRWKGTYIQDCDPQIKDVWNVGFLDYNPGLYHKKILRQCTKREAIEEGLHQLRHSQYVQGLLRALGKSFDEVFLGLEDWYQFTDQTPDHHLVSLNPKFSTNVGTKNLMPRTNQPLDLPSNMYLAGYYVQSTMGGVSMEASCETGLGASHMLLQKYGHNPKLPLSQSNEYLSKVTLPLVWLDKVLYRNNLPPLITYINPLILFLIYIGLILFFVIMAIKASFGSGLFQALSQSSTLSTPGLKTI